MTKASVLFGDWGEGAAFRGQKTAEFSKKSRAFAVFLYFWRPTSNRFVFFASDRVPAYVADQLGDLLRHWLNGDLQAVASASDSAWVDSGASQLVAFKLGDFTGSRPDDCAALVVDGEH